MNTPHPIIAQLRDERRSRGLSQTDIVHRAGIGRTSLSDWERGARLPSLTALQIYLDALGLRLIAVPAEDAGDDAPGEQIPFGELVVGAGEKFCPSCRQAHAIRDFHADKSRRDGLKYRCRFCCNDADRRRYHRDHNSGEAAA